MTAPKTVVLHCDGNGCTRRFTGLSERIWVARREPWGESADDHLAKQNVDVPLVGDDIQLRMGRVVVISRCLEQQPDYDEEDHRVSSWYWCLIVKRYGR